MPGHSRNPGYVPGDYWMVCDRCGFDYRKSQMREEWTGLWVCRKCFDPRHPQLDVQGRADQQAVPVARPGISTFWTELTLTVAASYGDSTITVSDASDIADGDAVGVLLDDETTFWTFSDGDPAGNVVTLKTSLGGDAANGNTVYIDALSEPTVTADDL